MQGAGAPFHTTSATDGRHDTVTLSEIAGTLFVFLVKHPAPGFPGLRGTIASLDARPQVLGFINFRNALFWDTLYAQVFS